MKQIIDISTTCANESLRLDDYQIMVFGVNVGTIENNIVFPHVSFYVAPYRGTLLRKKNLVQLCGLRTTVHLCVNLAVV